MATRPARKSRMDHVMKTQLDGDDRETKTQKGPDGGKGAGSSRGAPRRGAGGRHKNDNGRINIQDKNVKQVFAMMAKQTLQNTQQLRQIRPAVFDMFMIKKAHNVFINLEQEREKYVQMQKSEDRVEFSPTPYLLVVLIDSLANEQVGQANQRALNEESTRLDTADLGEIENMVTGIYWEKVYDKDMVRLLLGMTHYHLRTTVISALKQLEFKHLVSRAPPGYMENRLGQMLEDLES